MRGERHKDDGTANVQWHRQSVRGTMHRRLLAIKVDGGNASHQATVG